jgi:hypothetical protein
MKPGGAIYWCRAHAAQRTPETAFEPRDLGAGEHLLAAIEKDPEAPARPVVQEHPDFVAND